MLTDQWIRPALGIASPHTIAWPPDMAVVMNVTGYADALQSAALVMLDDGLAIRVASIPGLAGLKLIAWTDRGKSDAKDAHDLLMLLRRYTDAGNHDRLYNEHFSLVESAGYDPEFAGAQSTWRRSRGHGE